jgi:hypothetical protein
MQAQRALKGHIARVAAVEQRSTRDADLFAQVRLGNVRRVQDIVAGLVVTEQVYVRARGCATAGIVFGHAQ